MADETQKPSRAQALISASKVSPPRAVAQPSDKKSHSISRRKWNLFLVAGLGGLSLCGMAALAAMVDFLSPKALKEPRKSIRVGRLEDFGRQETVYEQFKSAGIWLVDLRPGENKLIALSTICTHLGCIPNWLASQEKFKCPCHGSGYTMNGVNFEGPAPRPLERFAIAKRADGSIVVDMSRTFRRELGEWENPDSFVKI